MKHPPTRHLSLQFYLLSLIVVAALLGGAAMIHQQHLRMDDAHRSAVNSLSMVSGLAAKDISDAIDQTRTTTAEVAANPGLAALFKTPTPQGCSLTFAGIGPFQHGHVDVISHAGQVLCSSRDLPKGAPYAGEKWLDAPADRVVGPVQDAGRSALAVISPVSDRGVVVTFLRIDDLPSQLSNRYVSTLPIRYALITPAVTRGDTAPSESGRITREAKIPSLGWTVAASTSRDDAFASVRKVNRDTTMVFVLGVLFVLALTEVIYLGIARPIRRLSSSVRQATAERRSIDPPRSGPAEVVSLGNDFATLTRDLASELGHRAHAEAELKDSEQTYRTIFEANPQPTWVHHSDTGALMAVNEAMVQRFGRTREKLLTMRYHELLEESSSPLTEVLHGSDLVDRSGPWQLLDSAGKQVDALITSDTLNFGGNQGRIVVAEDVTAQLHTQRLLQRTERMESLGQLAGGIAHDFNNLLAVILNYAEFATEQVAEAAIDNPGKWEPVLADVRQIGTAGNKAATLTRQLLSFARGDVLEVGHVNLNTVTLGIEQLLRRTLGEQVELDFQLATDLPPVEANAGQLEQVIINLAVNARDAMPEGGKLSVQTADVLVDAEHTAARPERVPGRYVRLRVSDNGIGMDAQAREHAFEPFFTTKHRVNGTGLGLATVYGIVTRAGGTIDIYSEPDLGTTISMFLPATIGETEENHTPAVAKPRAGTETILLVEDDDALRSMAERILRRDGYQVLTASDGPSGEAVAQQRREEIDLLLTDVVMPGMLGSELARRVTAANPSIGVLFMSGYAPPGGSRGGTLPDNAVMVDKPFSATRLLDQVRLVLDTQSNGAGTEHF
ncbi:MAG TPA: ATP-binding protein [Nocardioidaceae bacterium]|nr:ATP-binding protein [Nocardioidaceae bacterium]